MKLGIFPGFNGTARSIRQAGAPAAMQVMLTGKMHQRFGGARHGPRRRAGRQPRSLLWAARKAVLRKRKSKPAGFAKAVLSMWPARGLLASRMRQEVRKKAREDHYPAPFRLIDLFEKHGGNEEAMKAAETRAFAPLMVSRQVEESAPRVLAVGAAEGRRRPRSSAGARSACTSSAPA